MSGMKILVPFNFGANDQKALDFVIKTFGHLEEVEVTLFHAYTPPPKIEAARQEVTSRLGSNINYINQRIKEQNEALRKELEPLLEGGFQTDRLNCIYEPRDKDVASEIIDVVNKWRYNVVVLNHKSGKITRYFTGTVFNKVVMGLTNTTVCIVS